MTHGIGSSGHRFIESLNPRPLATLISARRLLPLGCLCVVAWAAGCAQDQHAKPTTRPASASQRQDHAMRDPFNYRPDWHDTDISGGGTTDLDRQGLKRDVDNALLR